MSAQERVYSVEFFPPKDEAGAERLAKARKRLGALNPEFYSVTFGAGGSTRDRTLETVRDIIDNDGIPAAPHVSCISSTKDELRDLLSTYRDSGVKRIVALRGDLPSGTKHSGGDFRYASELVEFVRAEFGDQFKIEVAAYPEFHPQAPNAEKDLENFKTKVDAGADAAITQYFYNPDAYVAFMERVEKMGITIPIIAGIMPITNYTQIVRFSEMCGAEIPRYIRKRMEAYGDDKESIRKFGIEVATRLTDDLLDNGAPGIHFYSMNQAGPTEQIWKALDLDNRK
ncbi:MULTISPECIES: methylenetetrahydrofolate reductase [NAD(P)H] [unclassified Thioalkalivibrio]|uniref:methylenetetrahydrofolate reductase [NAD(P)H] n=1 Tax=unclassified Thioalkalivibrio TaxID=2621013 RepID=UPI0003642539|nr:MULTISPECIES: methylenetetrahydrofolate reductase [NAD(P)H] [unclassified Thioalkalivibrio]